MKNFFIIAIVLVSMYYMGVILVDKFNNIKETNAKIEQQKSKEVKPPQ